MTTDRTPTTDRERLALIQARVAATTTGTWSFDGGTCIEIAADLDQDRFDALPETVARIELCDADGYFIAHAPHDVRYLLAQLADQSAALERAATLANELRNLLADQRVPAAVDNTVTDLNEALTTSLHTPQTGDARG